MNKLIEASVVLIQNEENKYMVGRITRDKPDRNPGMWEFFGGKVDPGEDFVQAAIRESKEETGLDVEVCEFLGSYESNGYFCHAYICNVLGGDIVLEDCDIHDWLSREQLLNLEELTSEAKYIVENML